MASVFQSDAFQPNAFQIEGGQGAGADITGTAEITLGSITCSATGTTEVVASTASRGVGGARYENRQTVIHEHPSVEKLRRQIAEEDELVLSMVREFVEEMA